MTKRTRRSRLGAAAVIAVCSLIAVLAASGGRAAAVPNAKPTIVLVHGAWADATSWDEVTPLLHADGYQTVTPNLALTSLAGDVANVRSVLNSIPGRKILVAHSYGGMVISAAAYGRSDVAALVFSAAFVPALLDSIATLGIGHTSSPAFMHLAFTGAPFLSPAYIAPNLFRQYFAQDLTPDQAGLLDAAQQPLNFSIVATPSGPVAWSHIPSWYAVSGQDRMIDPAEERFMATRAGAHTIEFADASHAGGIVRHAGQFTALIEQAVTATNH